VDSGEVYDQSAVRELREELGLIVPAPPRRLFKIPACRETDQEHVWVYGCDSEGPFTLHPVEIEDGCWVSPEEVTGWVASRPQDFAPAFAYLWGLFRERA
jgi:8-oxo-dGTP pyrophosphatase MutT (NUDIX family)